MDHTMNGGSAVAFFCFSLRIQPFYPFQIVVLVEGEIEGRVSIASNAVVYTTATFALQNACWGSAPNPFDLHFPMQAAPPCGMLLKMSIVTSYEKIGYFLA